MKQLFVMLSILASTAAVLADNQTCTGAPGIIISASQTATSAEQLKNLLLPTGILAKIVSQNQCQLNQKSDSMITISCREPGVYLSIKRFIVRQGSELKFFCDGISAP